MYIDTVTSAGGSGHNEDLVEVWRSDAYTDIILLDGGTSVADRNYADEEAGDIVWLVRTFCAALKQVAGAGQSQSSSVARAVRQAKEDFLQRTKATTVPPYAWPIAALTWVRITPAGDAFVIDTYSLGDCKTFLRLPDDRVLDLDPYTNPQELVLQSELARLAEQGVADPALRRERMVPMLRARRAFLNASPEPAVLCLDPRGPFHARQGSTVAPQGSTLIAMTDGLYRIVDTYRCRSIEEVAGMALQQGLQPIMEELRGFETSCAVADSMSVKSADDATGVICRLGPGPAA